MDAPKSGRCVRVVRAEIHPMRDGSLSLREPNRHPSDNHRSVDVSLVARAFHVFPLSVKSGRHASIHRKRRVKKGSRRGSYPCPLFLGVARRLPSHALPAIKRSPVIKCSRPARNATSRQRMLAAFSFRLREKKNGASRVFPRPSTLLWRSPDVLLTSSLTEHRVIGGNTKVEWSSFKGRHRMRGKFFCRPSERSISEETWNELVKEV